MKDEKPVIIQPECPSKGKVASFFIGVLVGAVVSTGAFIAFALILGRGAAPQDPQQMRGGMHQMQMPDKRDDREPRPPKNFQGGCDLDDEEEE